jgi:hypothetical protein
MAEVFLGPQSQALVAAGTNILGAPGSQVSAVITLAAADSYAFVLNVTAITGTSPTLDCALQVTPDGGTTWFDWFRFAQVTANTALTRRLIVQPMQGRGEVGSEGLITAGGTGAINANCPFPGALSQIRFRYTIGGTSPNYTFGIFMFAQTKQSAI